MNILALDCATKTGWATLIDGHAESGVQDFTKRRGESNGMLFMNFNKWLSRACSNISLDLIIYEQAHHRGGAATEIGVGLMTRVYEFAEKYHVEYAPVHTNTLKKATTGSGRASKQDMMDWFENTVGRKPIDDNEADARAILEYAIREYGGRQWHGLK